MLNSFIYFKMSCYYITTSQKIIEKISAFPPRKNSLRDKSALSVVSYELEKGGEVYGKDWKAYQGSADSQGDDPGRSGPASVCQQTDDLQL
jgi:hypothetical protein